MNLSESIKACVRDWVTEGLSLAKIQQKLADEHDCPLTFMEVRFLVDDLELDLPKSTPTAKGPVLATDPSNTIPIEASPLEPIGDNDAVIPGQVTVSVDRLQRPGAVMSGSVTFGNGEQGTWQVDQLGRLGISPAKVGYQPSPADIQAFQEALQSQLHNQGI